MAKRVTAAGPVEGPWTLPEGWRWDRLSSVCLPVEKGSPASRFTASFRYTDVGGIGEGSEAKIVAVARAPSRARQFVRAGDTLFSGVRINLRRTVFVEPDTTDVASTAFSVLSPGSEIDPRYLFRWMTTDFLVESLIPLQRGSQPPAVLDNDVRAQPIPVPPIEVQCHLVRRIDELFDDIDDGEAALARARDDLATWRKALLKAAVTGELTADWRAKNPPAESGVALLARVLLDRRARWELEPRNARKKYAEPRNIGVDKSEALPAGWANATIEQAAFVENGQTPKGIEDVVTAEGDIPWFKVSSMNAPGNSDRLTQSAWWLSAASAAKLGLRVHPAGSIVFPKRGGSIFTEKKRRLGCPGSVDLNVMAVVPIDTTADHLWTFFRNLSLRAISDGSNVPQINYGDVADLRIMLPPPNEAQEISARVESALAITSEVEADIDQFFLDAATLRQSILNAAFRGELA